MKWHLSCILNFLNKYFTKYSFILPDYNVPPSQCVQKEQTRRRMDICECVCVCVREGEREREKIKREKERKDKERMREKKSKRYK